MFRQLKSAIIWYYLYKFRRRVALILTLVLFIFLSEYIYSDVVEYLQIRHKTEWLDLILPLKWASIFTAIFLIFYLLFTIFQAPNDYRNVKETQEHSDKKRKLSKKEIRELAKRLIEEKKGT